MTFADQLRNYNADEERNRRIQYELSREVPLLIRNLEEACQKANINNRRSISIYLTSWLDDGYTEYGYLEQLPTVQQEIEESKRFNKEKHTNYGRNYVGTGNFEHRLYEKLISFRLQKMEYGRTLQQLLNNEVSKMDFNSFKVSLIELDDIYIVHNRKASLFTGTVSETLSTRSTGKIYAINIQAAW